MQDDNTKWSVVTNLDIRSSTTFKGQWKCGSRRVGELEGRVEVCINLQGEERTSPRQIYRAKVLFLKKQLFGVSSL